MFDPLKYVAFNTIIPENPAMLLIQVFHVIGLTFYIMSLSPNCVPVLSPCLMGFPKAYPTVVMVRKHGHAANRKQKEQSCKKLKHYKVFIQAFW